MRLVRRGMLFLLLAGCGGASHSSKVNGTIRGRTFQPADAISAAGSIAQRDRSAEVGIIALSSSGGLCGKVSAGSQPKNTQYLLLFVYDQDTATGQTSAPGAAGTYRVSGTGQPLAKQAIAVYLQTDASCNEVADAGASSAAGTVTLSSVSNGNYEGTFDLTLDSGDHITGSFSASNCPGLPGFLNESSTTCI
jgi:hypothetical protein